MVTKSFKAAAPAATPLGKKSGDVNGCTISAAAQDGGEDMNTNKRSSPSSMMPQPVAVSILLNTEPGGEAKKDNINDCPLSQNPEQVQLTAAPSHVLLKSPPEKSQHTTGSEPQRSIAATAGVNSSAASHVQAKPPPLPIKRTKKMAKPKSKTASRARKLPTKKQRLNNGPKPAGVGDKTTLPHDTPVDAKTKKKRRYRTKRTKRTTSDTNEEPVKKRARRKKQQSATTKSQDQESPTKKKGEKSPIPPEASRGNKRQQAITEDMQIEMVVSDVVDVVASEIHHCASMLSENWPKVVIEGEECDMPNKKISESRQMPGLGPVPGQKQSSTGSFGHGSKSIYYARISEDGDIDAVDKSACLMEPSKKSRLANPKDFSFSPTACSELETRIARSLVIAVRRFVNEVYCPFLFSAKKNMGNKTPNNDRIQLSTLLAIREMLTMNADKLFVFPSLKQSPTFNRERKFRSHVFADAIVRNALKRLQSHQSKVPLPARFLQVTQSYDARSDEFQFSMERADVRSRYVSPNGKAVGPEESLLAKVGLNYARASHPLLHSKPSGGSITCPVPTACAAFHIEASIAPTSDEEKDNTEEVLEALEHALRS